MAKRQYFRVPGFTGGLNPDVNSQLLRDDEATAVRNFRLDKPNSLITRYGYTNVITYANTIQALGVWRDPSNPATSSIMQKRDSGALVARKASTDYSLATGLSTSAKGGWISFEDRAVYFNGVDRPRYWQGDTAKAAYPLGVSAPAQPGGSLTTGTLNGTYKYVTTYYDSLTGSESNPSPERSMSPSTQGVTLTFSASSETRVDKVRIYRTNAGGSTFLFLTEVLDTAASYVDNGSVALGTTTPPSDHNIPGNFERMEYYKGYAFGSIGNTIYWAKALNADAWPPLNSTEVPFDGNDTIITMVSFQDTLIIFGRFNILLLNGSGGLWSLNRIDVGMGIVGPEAHTQIDGTLVFLSERGLRAFPGLQPFAAKLDRTLNELPLTTKDTACMAFVPEEQSLWLCLNSLTYVIALNTGAIGTYTFRPDHILQGGIDGFSFPYFSIGAGLKQYGSTSGDAGALFTALWRSKMFTMNDPEPTKHIRRLGAFSTKGGTATVTATIADNTNSYTVNLTPTDTGDLSLWDTMDWGDNWSGEGTSYFVGSMPAHVLLGRILQITITTNTDKPVEVVPPFTIEYRTSNRLLGG